MKGYFKCRNCRHLLDLSTDSICTNHNVLFDDLDVRPDDEYQPTDPNQSADNADQLTDNAIQSTDNRLTGDSNQPTENADLPTDNSGQPTNSVDHQTDSVDHQADNANQSTDNASRPPASKAPETVCEDYHYFLIDSKLNQFAWIVEQLDKADWTRGKINCPNNCGAKLGTFNFVNCSKCSCGKETVPSVHIIKSRVDFHAR